MTYSDGRFWNVCGAPGCPQSSAHYPVRDDRALQLTTAAGLTLSGRIFSRHFVDGMKRCYVIEVLEDLRRYLPAGFNLLCDHAPIHTSTEMLSCLLAHPVIMIESLPKYAPDPNPEEYGHGHAKLRLATAIPKQPAEMRRPISRALTICASSPTYYSVSCVPLASL